MVKAVILLVGLIAATRALPRPTGNVPQIVGGGPAAKNELPYQVTLQYFGHYCGGSIVNERYVVTAAHCMGGAVQRYSIIAGELSLRNNDGTEQARQVKSYKVHEDYVSYASGNDIALLELEEPLEFNDAVQPIAIAPEGHTATGDVVVSGWGALSSGGSSPDVLQKVVVPVVTDERCRQSYGDSAITDSMICAGLPEGGKDSCQGDSGGPLVASDLGYRYLAGIVSWGYGCAAQNYFGVYTEVSYFADWIAKNTV